MPMSMSTLLRNMSTKYYKYVANEKSILMISIQRTVRLNESVFFGGVFFYQNKICSFPKTRYIYLRLFFIKRNWTNSFNLSFRFECGIVV